MRTLAYVLIVSAIILISIQFKMWQCSELFPDASVAACLFWK